VLEHKVGHREAAIATHATRRALPRLTSVPLEAMEGKLGRTRNASPLECGHKCR